MLTTGACHRSPLSTGTRAFNVNLFVHGPARPDAARENAWLRVLTPFFAAFDAAPPANLRTIFKSFADDPDMLAMLLDMAPPVVSFHFGLPPAEALSALRARGIYLMATATNPWEARAIAAAGVDAIVAQGIEAGDHRGVFDPSAPDEALGTMVLTRLLMRQVSVRSSRPAGSWMGPALRLRSISAR